MTAAAAEEAWAHRWRGRDRFVVLLTGHIDRFLSIWLAWRNDDHRPTHLDVILIAEADAAVDIDAMLAHELAAELRAAWPPTTPGLHRLSLAAGRVNLLLARGRLPAWLPELVARIDAFDLDDFEQPARIAKALGRLAAADATLSLRSVDPAHRSALTAAGFECRPIASGVADAALTRARYAPRFTPKSAPGRTAAHRVGRPAGPRRAVIVGAGLAGCAAAWALAEQGWHSLVIEKAPQIALGASGNPAGLFHGIVNAQDGTHARFNRAAALMARDSVQAAIDLHQVAGSTSGLLRLETGLTTSAMHDVLTRLGLPPSYVQALDAQQASARSGLPLDRPAWFYPGGGWVAPAGLAASFLARASGYAELQCSVVVERLERCASGWKLFGSGGQLLAEAEVVVLANAGDAMRLLDHPAWPIERVRGQISTLPNAVERGLALPRLPIAGAGYLLPGIAGAAVFGSTAQAGDEDPSVRDDDHSANLAQLARLIGREVIASPSDLTGRTAWRWSAADRLPVIGAVPDSVGAAVHGVRLDQPRFVPRLPGLYVFTALGSRGITWSSLGAQVLAAAVSGASQVLEASLLAAIDPARFVSRAARREGAA